MKPDGTTTWTLPGQQTVTHMPQPNVYYETQQMVVVEVQDDPSCAQCGAIAGIFIPLVGCITFCVNLVSMGVLGVGVRGGLESLCVCTCVLWGTCLRRILLQDAPVGTQRRVWGMRAGMIGMLHSPSPI